MNMNLQGTVIDNKVFNLDSNLAQSISLLQSAKRMDMKPKKYGMDMEGEEAEMPPKRKDMKYEDKDDSGDPGFQSFFDALSARCDGAESAQAVLEHIDSMNGRISALEAMLQHDDSEENEEHADSLEERVQERLDGMWSAYEEAKPFLASDYKLDGTKTAHQIKLDALAATFGEEFKIDSDSEAAVNAAFTTMQSTQKRSDSSAPSPVAAALHQDMGGSAYGHLPSGHNKRQSIPLAPKATEKVWAMTK